jgi:hypothetical protein
VTDRVNLEVGYKHKEVRMSKVPAVQLQDINGNKVPATTSLAIAEFTGLKHFHVLRDIDRLIESGKFSESSVGF